MKNYSIKIIPIGLVCFFSACGIERAVGISDLGNTIASDSVVQQDFGTYSDSQQTIMDAGQYTQDACVHPPNGCYSDADCPYGKKCTGCGPDPCCPQCSMCYGECVDESSMHTCETINAQYKQEVFNAQVCHPWVSMIQCTLEVQTDLACPCAILVNPANTTAIANIHALQNKWNNHNCYQHPWNCPYMPCHAPSGTCVAMSGVAPGLCQ